MKIKQDVKRKESKGVDMDVTDIDAVLESE